MPNYICPGCLFYNINTPVKYKHVCSCLTCNHNLKHETDPTKRKLLSAFVNHSKSGFKCPDCCRFLPQSLDKNNVIICPYPNCVFIGRSDSLKRMRHPATKNNVVKVDLNISEPAPNIVPILNIIKEHVANLHYVNNNGCSAKQKTFVYQAFENLLKRYPNDMSKYLLQEKRGSSLQSKLFQEYVSILENNIPFSYRKGKKLISVDSLNHPKFLPFEGLSKFDAVVDDSRNIKNNTKEIYIGSRKSYYCQSCYIGKLLDVVDESGKSLLSNVLEYSFSIIKTNLSPGTKVHVSHLRIPAHYQVGILSHINRIKKQITNSLKEQSNQLIIS